MEFKDKIVVVTGGAAGIGKTIVNEFLKAGPGFASSIKKRIRILWVTWLTRMLLRPLPIRSSGSTAGWTA
jgi:hypothetical protein